jgi:signal transduction histidine kinase
MSAQAFPIPNLASSLAKLPDARRAPPPALVAEIQAVSGSPVVSALLEAVDGALLVLNAQRQIVASNGRTVRLARPEVVLGKRPGEALGCVNAQGDGGCGAAPACLHCGALSAIVASQADGRPAEAECLLRADAGDAGCLELNVRATPVSVEGHRFTVMSLRDVSAEKRRDTLEQIFLHDLLNSVAALRGWVSRLGSGDTARTIERVDRVSVQLEREIRDHRALVLAEQGTLVPEHAEVRAGELFDELEAVFAQHAAAQDRCLVVERSPGLVLETDRALLVRVLVNMVRNALEATPAGGAVRLRACADPSALAGRGGVRFSVHNAGAIPHEVQHRIFVRSFTTKDERGHGLGTYSMKLLGERFLGGKVSFTSAPETGTTFFIELPATV